MSAVTDPLRQEHRELVPHLADILTLADAITEEAHAAPEAWEAEWDRDSDDPDDDGPTDALIPAFDGRGSRAARPPPRAGAR